MPSETTWIAFCGPQHEVKASATSLALLLLRRWLKEEDALKALSERKEVRTNRERHKNKEMNSVLSPTRLYRLEVRGKRGGETAQGSASLEALSVQQKIMVHFFLESDIFIGLLTGACDRLISNLSQVTVLGNCSTFWHFSSRLIFLLLALYGHSCGRIKLLATGAGTVTGIWHSRPHRYSTPAQRA